MIRQISRLFSKQVPLLTPSPLHYSLKYSFSLSNQQLQQMKEKLDQLYVKFDEEENLSSRVNLMKSVIDLKQDIKNQFDGKEGEPYIGFRRDLLMLAQLAFQNDEKEKCIQLLNQIMEGDYKNELSDQKEENEAFLAEMHTLNSMANMKYLDKAYQEATQALKHLEYFVDNHCPLYQLVSEGKTVDKKYELDAELSYLQNLISHLQLVSKITIEKGNFEEAAQTLGYRATILDRQGHLFRQIFDKKITVQTEKKEMELQRHFMGIIIQQGITLKNIAKLCLILEKFDDCQGLLEAALNYFDFLIDIKVIDNYEDNYIGALLIDYEYNLQTQQTSKFGKLLEKIENVISKNSDKLSIYSKIQYELFKCQYQQGDVKNLKELINQLENDLPLIIEYSNELILLYKEKGQNDQVLNECILQLDRLNQYYDPSHYLYGESLLLAIDSSAQIQQFDKSQSFIEQLEKNKKQMNYLQDIEILIEEAKAKVQLQKLNSKDDLNQLFKKVSQLECLSLKTTITKQYLLAQISKKIGETNQYQRQLEECVNTLKTQGFYLTKQLDRAIIRNELQSTGSRVKL